MFTYFDDIILVPSFHHVKDASGTAYTSQSNVPFPWISTSNFSAGALTRQRGAANRKKEKRGKRVKIYSLAYSTDINHNKPYQRHNKRSINCYMDTTIKHTGQQICDFCCRICHKMFDILPLPPRWSKLFKILKKVYKLSLVNGWA